MPQPKTALRKYLIGKYVCPNTDEVVPVWSSVPMEQMDCPATVDHCQACGESHYVGCEDILEADDDSDLE